MEPAWLTCGALSHPLPFFFSAFPSSPPLLFLSAALGRWKQPSCLSLRDGSLPSPAPPGTGGEQLSQQCWRRRIRCAGMEQPVPVSQQRFNLPLAYKQQMFVQLTCKQAACIAVGPRSLAPHSAALRFLPSSRGMYREMGQGTRVQPHPGCLGHPKLGGWRQGAMLRGTPSCAATAASLLLP